MVFHLRIGSVSDDDDGDGFWKKKREERKAKRSTLKEVLDLLGLSVIDGLLAVNVLDLGVSSMGQQDLDDFDVSLLTGPHQSCL